MKVYGEPHRHPDGRYEIITVVLSERNLKTLLLKVLDETSAKTLIDKDSKVRVIAERDKIHYEDHIPCYVLPEHDPGMNV